MIKIFIILFFSLNLYSTAFEKPSLKFKASNGVTDILFVNDKLYTATDSGAIDIFDFESQKIIQTIQLDKITDFMNETIESKIYSIDILDKKMLILSQGKKGARRLHLYENEILELLIPYTKKLFIAKAKFLNKDTILLGLLSNEIISYNIQEKKENYRYQVSFSKFSDFALNEDKTQISIADESGDIKIHSTQDTSLLKELQGQNLDNVFKLANKNHIIATAGQDRRVVIYDTKRDSVYYKKSNFLIYGVGLSPQGLHVAYSSDEHNNITVFDTKTKRTLGIFTGNKMTINNILFINENEFFVSSDDSTVNLYKIK